jgi:arabinose-5-phosphate isomerase
MNIKVLPELDRVFQLEIETLVKVRKSLNGDYTRAAEMLFACSGKVVVTGMGKSGLIAQKIVGTMVSTGTSAVFLHPSDAMHGDVGIIRAGDVVLAVSKSGESEEILGLLPYIKEVGAPVISITVEPESSMAKGSDLVLYTPVDAEACPLNLAPTSSTTAALVVGDALAMALMKMRGFQPSQFALLHPGGQLGKRLTMTVADIMRSGENNPVVKVNGTIREMLYEITGKLSGAVSVADDEGRLIGLVTDHDIRNALEQGKDLFSLSITDVMNENPTHISSDAMAIEALDLMENRDVPFMVLPVLEQSSKVVVGMVHLHDLVAQGL